MGGQFALRKILEVLTKGFGIIIEFEVHGFSGFSIVNISGSLTPSTISALAVVLHVPAEVRRPLLTERCRTFTTLVTVDE